MKTVRSHTKITGALALALFSSVAHAQAPRTVYLYSAAVGQGSSGLNAAQAAPWGNGSVQSTGNISYQGGSVLSLTTRNLQEGARFDLNEPLDLNAYQQNGFLRLRLRFNSGGGGFGGGFGGRFGGRGRFGGGGGFGGGFGGRGGWRGGGGGGNNDFQMRMGWQSNAQMRGALPAFGGAADDPQAADAQEPDQANTDAGVTAPPPPQQTGISEFAVTLIRDSGATATRIPVDLNSSTPDEEGWRLFVIPIKSFHSTPDAAGPVRRVVITSDGEDTFYMAQAAFAVESGKMTASLRRPEDPVGAQIAEIQVKPGRLTLVADVEAGSSDPTIEWNFDADNVGNLPPGAISSPVPVAPTMLDANGMPIDNPTQAFVGPRIDARGLTAVFDYPNEEQDYRVEITVRDRSGQKDPVTASILVKVRA